MSLVIMACLRPHRSQVVGRLVPASAHAAADLAVDLLTARTPGQSAASASTSVASEGIVPTSNFDTADDVS